MKLKDAAAVNEFSETIVARDDEFGYMEVRRIGDSQWVSTRNVETTSCYGCGHAVLVAYDDDGTPRLTEPIE